MPTQRVSVSASTTRVLQSISQDEDFRETLHWAADFELLFLAEVQEFHCCLVTTAFSMLTFLGLFFETPCTERGVEACGFLFGIQNMSTVTYIMQVPAMGYAMYHIERVQDPPPRPDGCSDSNASSCSEEAADGACGRDPVDMHARCPVSCDACQAASAGSPSMPLCCKHN